MKNWNPESFRDGKMESGMLEIGNWNVGMLELWNEGKMIKQLRESLSETTGLP